MVTSSNMGTMLLQSFQLTSLAAWLPMAPDMKQM